MYEGVGKMVKCPACGESSSLYIIDQEVYIWNDIISIYITYGCECGRKFITRTQVNRSNEEMYDIDI